MTAVPTLTKLAERRTGMFIQFLLFVITVLLFAIFWELTKINSRLKKALPSEKQKAPVAPSSQTGD